jgi:hypothetical protein
MYSAEYEIELDLEREHAWQKLRDITQPDCYVQGLTRVEMTTEQREGVGASRRVHQGKSIVLDETVTEWREGKGFTLRLHRGEKGPVPPMQEAWFDYGIRERDGCVYLHNCMRYRVGLGPFGRLLNALLLRKMIASAVRDTTIGQKFYYERGDKVTPARLKAAKAELADAA